MKDVLMWVGTVTLVVCGMALGAQALHAFGFVETDLPGEPPVVPYVSVNDGSGCTGDCRGVLLDGTHPGGDVIRERVLPPYKRSDWRHWLDADGDGEDARIEVLKEESHMPMVRFTDRGGSQRIRGVWKCPFTGEVFTTPSEPYFEDGKKKTRVFIDIDHRVPLEEAHLSGGHAWDVVKRAQYANDLDDPDHLVAVKAGANRSKGARDPASWMPKVNECGYAIAWVRVKERWKLTYDAAETTALLAAIGTCAPRFEDGDDDG